MIEKLIGKEIKEMIDTMNEHGFMVIIKVMPEGKPFYSSELMRKKDAIYKKYSVEVHDVTYERFVLSGGAYGNDLKKTILDAVEISIWRNREHAKEMAAILDNALSKAKNKDG